MVVLDCILGQVKVLRTQRHLPKGCWWVGWIAGNLGIGGSYSGWKYDGCCGNADLYSGILGSLQPDSRGSQEETAEQADSAGKISAEQRKRIEKFDAFEREDLYEKFVFHCKRVYPAV